METGHSDQKRAFHAVNMLLASRSLLCEHLKAARCFCAIKKEGKCPSFHSVNVFIKAGSGIE